MPTISKIIKGNFLWMPLLVISVLNITYLIFVLFGMSLIAIENNPSVSKMSVIEFICAGLIVKGWGLPAILGAILVGSGVGFLTSLFRKKPLSSTLKRKIVCFLSAFYLLITLSIFCWFFT